MSTKHRRYLLHPSSFETLLSYISEKNFNKILSEISLTDVGAFRIYEDIYAIAASRITKKTHAERLVKSIKQILSSMDIVKTLPENYSAIARFGKMTNLGFVDAAHIYTCSKLKMSLITKDKTDAEYLSRYTQCVEVETFAKSLME
ncbi:MAG: PIN domain-containing protein [Conexivisphaerales archaeon]